MVYIDSWWSTVTPKRNKRLNSVEFSLELSNLLKYKSLLSSKLYASINTFEYKTPVELRSSYILYAMALALVSIHDQ